MAIGTSDGYVKLVDATWLGYAASNPQPFPALVMYNPRKLTPSPIRRGHFQTETSSEPTTIFFQRGYISLVFWGEGKSHHQDFCLHFLDSEFLMNAAFIFSQLLKRGTNQDGIRVRGVVLALRLLFVCFFFGPECVPFGITSI